MVKDDEKIKEKEFATRAELTDMGKRIVSVREDIEEVKKAKLGDAEGWNDIDNRIKNIEGMMNEMVERLPKKKERIRVKSDAEIDEEADRLLEKMLNDAMERTT